MNPPTHRTALSPDNQPRLSCGDVYFTLGTNGRRRGFVNITILYYVSSKTSTVQPPSAWGWREWPAVAETQPVRGHQDREDGAQSAAQVDIYTIYTVIYNIYSNAYNAQGHGKESGA